MNPILVFGVLVGVGSLSGLRAFTPIALVSWLSVWGWMPLAGSPFWFIGTEVFAAAISVLALLELIGDKLPKTPARTEVMPLIGRIVTGGLSAGAVAFTAGRSWLNGVVLGGLGGFLGAFAGYHARHFIVQRSRVPDFVVALFEDIVTIAGSLFLVHNFFHTSL